MSLFFSFENLKLINNEYIAPKSTGPSMGAMARPPIPMGGGASAPSLQHTASAPPVAAPAAAALGGLFAGGMPTLRKTRGAAVDTGRGGMSCKFKINKRKKKVIYMFPSFFFSSTTTRSTTTYTRKISRF